MISIILEILKTKMSAISTLSTTTNTKRAIQNRLDKGKTLDLDCIKVTQIIFIMFLKGQTQSYLLKDQKAFRMTFGSFYLDLRSDYRGPGLVLPIQNGHTTASDPLSNKPDRGSKRYHTSLQPIQPNNNQTSSK